MVTRKSIFFCNQEKKDVETEKKKTLAFTHHNNVSLSLVLSQKSHFGLQNHKKNGDTTF